MSVADQAREPAWAGLEPLETPMRPVGDAWARRVRATIGRDGRIFTYQPGRQRPARFYRFRPSDGSPTLFLKTIPSDAVTAQLAGNDIAAWLATKGMAVSPLLHSYPRRLSSEYQLLAYRSIDARFTELTEQDLRTVGRHLAQMHNHLRNHPKARQVQDRSEKRDQVFEQLHARLADQLPTGIAQHLSTPSLPQGEAQVIHGDLNIGNLLFVRASDRLILLDFEDATHNWHNPLVDLAMALERLVLVRVDDDEQILRFGNSLVQGYLAGSTNRLALEASATSILQTLATRAQLLLGNSAASASSAAESEKFVFLYDLAERKRALLDTLWNTLDRR